MTTAAGLTDVGRHRPGNEDAHLLEVERGLFAVADGLGGHAAGEVASGIVVATLGDAAPAVAAAPDPAAELERVLRDADAEVRRQAAGERAGMGATVVALCLREGRAWILHAGDSRAYLCRAGGLRRLTLDHTPENAFLTSPGNAPRRSGMITNAVGVGERVWFDTDTADVAPGDRLLLCSDGLTDMVPDPDIARLLAAAPNPATACRALVNAALDAGGLDNVTVVVVEAS